MSSSMMRSLVKASMMVPLRFCSTSFSRCDREFFTRASVFTVLRLTGAAPSACCTISTVSSFFSTMHAIIAMIARIDTALSGIPTAEWRISPEKVPTAGAVSRAARLAYFALLVFLSGVLTLSSSTVVCGEVL